MNFDFSCIYWLYVPASVEKLLNVLSVSSLNLHTTINFKVLKGNFLLLPSNDFCLISTLENNLNVAQNLAFFIKNTLNVDIGLFMNDMQADIDYFERMGNPYFIFERYAENITIQGEIPVNLLTYTREIDYQDWQPRIATEKAFNFDIWATLSASKLQFYSFQLPNIQSYKKLAVHPVQYLVLKGQDNISSADNKAVDWDNIDLPF